MRAWTLGGLVALAVLVVGAAVVARHVIQTNATMARRAGQPIPVMVVEARRRDLTETLGATGSVVPVDFVNLTARVLARVQTVAVNIGDIVSPGRVLVRFETEQLKAAVDSAAAELERTRGDAARAVQQLSRVKAVFDQGLLPVTDLEKAQASVEAAQAQLAAAKARLVQAKLDLSYAVVAAPVVSVVTQRLVNPGETPSLNAPLLVLGRINPVLVAAQVSEEQMGAVRLQQPATVTFSAFLNEEFRGTVVRVDPTANKDTKTFAVFVRLANDDLRLKPGLTAFVRLERTHPGVLTVPSVALIYPTGLQESSLFVVESSRARLRKVAVGVMAEGRTTIVQGLQEGERVVTVGQLNLRDGDRVRLGDDDFKHLDTKRVGRPGSGAERGNAR